MWPSCLAGPETQLNLHTPTGLILTHTLFRLWPAEPRGPAQVAEACAAATPKRPWAHAWLHNNPCVGAVISCLPSCPKHAGRPRQKYPCFDADTHPPVSSEPRPSSATLTCPKRPGQPRLSARALAPTRTSGTWRTHTHRKMPQPLVNVRNAAPWYSERPNERHSTWGHRTRRRSTTNRCWLCCVPSLYPPTTLRTMNSSGSIDDALREERQALLLGDLLLSLRPLALSTPRTAAAASTAQKEETS